MKIMILLQKIHVFDKNKKIDLNKPNYNLNQINQIFF